MLSGCHTPDSVKIEWQTLSLFAKIICVRVAYIIFVFITVEREVIVLVSEMIDAVKNIENLALERQKSAGRDAKKILQITNDKARKFVDVSTENARRAAETRIAFAEKTAEETLKNNQKNVEKEVKKLHETVQERKKVAIKSVIEVVMN